MNEDRNQPPMVEQAPVVAAAPEPMTMAGVQAMIQMMLDRQMEETRRLLQHNREEVSLQVEEPEVNRGHSEGGDYSGTVEQAEPPVVERNDPKREINRDGRMYKNFLGAKPPSLYGSPKPVEIMDWISKMEMVFESCECSNK